MALSASPRARSAGILEPARPAFRNNLLGTCSDGIDERLPSLVGDAQRRDGALRLVERFSDDKRDGLAEEAHLVVLQDMQPLAGRRIDARLVRQIGQLFGIEMGEDGKHTGHAFDGGGLHAADPAETGRGADDDGIGLAGLVEIGGIAGATAHLARAVDAGLGFADKLGRHATSPAISSARMMVRGSSSTLK